jgi:hypothetical protein
MKTRNFKSVRMTTFRDTHGVTNLDTHTYRNDRGGYPLPIFKIAEGQIPLATANGAKFRAVRLSRPANIDTPPTQRIITAALSRSRESRADSTC